MTLKKPPERGLLLFVEPLETTMHNSYMCVEMDLSYSFFSEIFVFCPFFRIREKHLE